MTLFILSYLAGALTILAPCILPVVPFVFARVDRPFVRSSLPLLTGMVLSFAGVATLATLGGAWAADANELGRGAALVVLAVMGVALLLPTAAQRWTRPLVALGSRLTDAAQHNARLTGRSVLPSFVVGVATGLVWAGAPKTTAAPAAALKTGPATRSLRVNDLASLAALFLGGAGPLSVDQWCSSRRVRSQ